MRRHRAWVVMLVAVLPVLGCTGVRVASGPVPSASPPPAARAQPRTVLPAEGLALVGANNAAQLALATSRTLFGYAPTVVVADNDAAALAKASSTAVELGVPLLLAPAAGSAGAAAELRQELTRLQAGSIVPIGSAAVRWAGSAGAPDRAGDSPLPEVTPAAPLDQLLVLALDRPDSRAATSTARAAGARIVLSKNPDPRADAAAIAALAGRSTARVLALGAAFGPADRLRRRIDTAAAGLLLPGGGQVVFPGRRMVALYGHPGDAGMGSLGEQSLDAAIRRARVVAATYRPLVREPVVPAFEIIATVASGAAGPDGDYSRESTVAQLRPWVDAAERAGLYVVLDLQPGRTDFLTQARRYTPLLLKPHVGLALDPEWRLGPGQRHLAQIGSVSAAEINKTSAWLADLTRAHRLPQKLLIVHQFRLDMITNRASLETGHDELAFLIHADGFGTAGQKLNTWKALHINPPPRLWWGWKNFYDEDQPTFTPRQTLAVTPSPVFISYQ